MPSTVSLGRSVNADGSVLAVTMLPPTMRMSIPLMMYRLASVTTRLGTRPAATSRPFTIPQPRPIPRPTRNTTGSGMPGWLPNRLADR